MLLDQASGLCLSVSYSTACLMGAVSRPSVVQKKCLSRGEGLCSQYFDGELEYFLAGKLLDRLEKRTRSVIVVKRTNAWTVSVASQYFNRSCGALRFRHL